jgi:hypothetical protein
MVKPVPVIAAEFTVTADVPVEVRINVSVFAVFTVSLPKLRLDVLTVSWELFAAVPVPLRATVAVPPVVELLLMARLPVAVPAVAGMNCTCSVNDWFGLSVAGSVPPTMVKPAPVSAAEFTVTADVPVEVRINIIDFAVFTVSLPKLRLDVLTVSWELVAAVPVPLRATVAVPPVVELLLMARLPVAAPAVVGMNCT